MGINGSLTLLLSLVFLQKKTTKDMVRLHIATKFESKTYAAQNYYDIK